MKAFKKICTALMLLAFAFVFASCSNGSDSDDDDNGTNALAGNSYKYLKVDTKETVTTTYAFKDDTVTKTKTTQPTGYLEETPDTEIKEYKYTYNADAGLLYLNVVSWTSDEIKMTSMDDVYKYFAKVESCTVEEAKEFFGDEDMFAENISMCYFVKDNGNILLGDYFDDDEDVENSKFNYWKDGSKVRFKNGEVIELNNDEYDIEVDTKTKTFSPDKVDDYDEYLAAGSYKVTKATKTLKQLCDSNSSYDFNEANGYITITFSKLPSKMQSAPYNMTIGTEYKFIFDLDCDEYIKQ